MKLHLGCGTQRLEGWINIDAVKACDPDLVQDITEPLPYEDLSADEILAEDLLEHFDKYMRFVVFYEWARVLKIGGRITLQVPNFKKILYRFFKLGYDNFVDIIFGENLWQSKIYIGHFGNHKWGYSEKTLKEFVQLFGIEPVKIERPGLNLRLTGEKKRHVSQEELAELSIYAHANQFGGANPRVSLAVARQKIREFQQMQISARESVYEHRS